MKVLVFILLTCGWYFVLRQIAFFSFIGLIHLVGGFSWYVQGGGERFDHVRRRLNIARLTAAWLISLGLSWWLVSTRLPGIR
ncbi:MAG: hypothetical protein WCA16_04370 [Candidatus Sulfotelmatobacter sp.]